MRLCLRRIGLLAVLAFSLSNNSQAAPLKSSAQTGDSRGACVVLTGTFDPPHLGHLDVVQSAMTAVQSDCGIALLNKSSRFKPQMSSLALREQMAALLFGQDPRIAVADPVLTDAFAGFQHGPVLSVLRKRYPESRFYFVMGDDVLDRGGLVNFLVDSDIFYLIAYRHGTSKPLPQPPVQAKLIHPPGIQGCSSGAIRAAYQAGGIQPRCTTPNLDLWIRNRGLYGSPVLKPDSKAVPALPR